VIEARLVETAPTINGRLKSTWTEILEYLSWKTAVGFCSGKPKRDCGAGSWRGQIAVRLTQSDIDRWPKKLKPPTD